MSTKFQPDTRPFCYCGRLATQTIKGIHFCGRHKAIKKEVAKIGRYSGASKSENKWNDYK